MVYPTHKRLLLVVVVVVAVVVEIENIGCNGTASDR